MQNDVPAAHHSKYSHSPYWLVLHPHADKDSFSEEYLARHQSKLGEKTTSCLDLSRRSGIPSVVGISKGVKHTKEYD